jgi:hypothetical protein
LPDALPKLLGKYKTPKFKPGDVSRPLEPTTMLAVLLLCVPPPLETIERAIPFASLTPAQAAALEGKERLYKVTLDSAATEIGGRVGYDARHDDEPAVMRSVYLDRDVGEDATTVYVRAVQRVVKHPRRGVAVSLAGSSSIG